MNLQPARYLREKHGQNHQSIFPAKVKCVDKYGRHGQYGFKAHTKKDTENEAALCSKVICKDDKS